MRLFILLMSTTIEEDPDVLGYAAGYTYMECIIADVATYGVKVLRVASS